MKIKLSLLITLFMSSLFSQVDLSYYLPGEMSYDKNITTPKEALGFEIGNWHLSPEQTLNYLRILEQQSERIKIVPMGFSHEHRPTVLVIITSPANHNNLDEIKAQRAKYLDPKTSTDVNVGDMPGVVWLGYSIHGNESSGHNASPLVAYYLAAGKSPEIIEMLENTVILIEPFINPDGLNRFATWANMHKGKNLNADPFNREHKEYWPSGRTNHYWFDLNRDWMPAQQPETRARLKHLYQWLPNILNDHHEMGSNATFFFQPGIKSRNNPLIPQRTYDLTGDIAQYHIKALDEIGSLYFSKEIFDDFYIGKGSSFTDIVGIIGILYEQASSRGHLQKSIHGDLSFPFTIKNQVTTSLSTLQAAMKMRPVLHQHQKDFFNQALNLAENDKNVAYVLGSSDINRNHELKKVLHQHQIEVFDLAKDIKLNKYSYKKDLDFLIPLKQKQYRMIVSMFENRTSFKDSLFYDISAWNLAHSFNLHLAEIKSEAQFQNLKGSPFNGEVLKPGKVVANGNVYAYLIPWASYNSARALNRLLNKDIRCKVAQEPFEISIDGKSRAFNVGTIMIPVSAQTVKRSEISSLIDQITENEKIDIFGVSTGSSTKGTDLGSFNFAALKEVKPMLIVGDGISSNEAGEVWHLLDQRLAVNLPLIDMRFINKLDLNPYNVIIMVNGKYSAIDSTGIAHIKDWINLGGTLIATRSANKWLKEAKLAKIEFKEVKKINKDTVTVRRKYGDAWNFSGAQAIGGSIFEASLDLSHPLGYGFEKSAIPVFKLSQLFMKQNTNPYDTPLLFTANPLLSGYISDENYELKKNSAVINVFGLGKGRIISFIENPNFRGIWYGTNRLFMNALMFGQIIRSYKY